jgi:hypothetical protein
VGLGAAPAVLEEAGVVREGLASPGFSFASPGSGCGGVAGIAGVAGVALCGITRPLSRRRPGLFFGVFDWNSSSSSSRIRCGFGVPRARAARRHRDRERKEREGARTPSEMGIAQEARAASWKKVSERRRKRK